MPTDPQLVQRVRSAVNEARLVETALRLIEIPSPTCQAGAVADRLGEMLSSERFDVERPVANWPEAPAVVARLRSRQPGRTLQFEGHLDTVHLPFVAPRVEDGVLTGSGASDMKGGVAASIEAMRALRDADLLEAGEILFTAHDQHEGPWGDARQLYALIDAGLVGHGALIPEYLCDRLPIAGRGLAILEIRVQRAGEPVHEVLRPPGTPNVIAAGCELVRRFEQLNVQLGQTAHPIAGLGSIFIGMLHAGEIFNQSPTECRLQGTRRWLPHEPAASVAEHYQDILQDVARKTGTEINGNFILQREAFEMSADDPLIDCFQGAYQAIAGKSLAIGAKPFVDDGNALVARAHIPAITHGPDARGAHTLNERVPVRELVRVAQVYALTALAFCRGG